MKRRDFFQLLQVGMNMKNFLDRLVSHVPQANYGLPNLGFFIWEMVNATGLSIKLDINGINRYTKNTYRRPALIWEQKTPLEQATITETTRCLLHLFRRADPAHLASHKYNQPALKSVTEESFNHSTQALSYTREIPTNRQPKSCKRNCHL